MVKPAKTGMIILDGFVKSCRKLIFVIPLKKGPALGGINRLRIVWISASAGMTTFYELVILDLK